MKIVDKIFFFLLKYSSGGYVLKCFDNPDLAFFVVDERSGCDTEKQDDNDSNGKFMVRYICNEQVQKRDPAVMNVGLIKKGIDQPDGGTEEQCRQNGLSMVELEHQVSVSCGQIPR